MRSLSKNWTRTSVLELAWNSASFNISYIRQSESSIIRKLNKRRINNRYLGPLWVEIVVDVVRLEQGLVVRGVGDLEEGIAHIASYVSHHKITKYNKMYILPLSLSGRLFAEAFSRVKRIDDGFDENFSKAFAASDHNILDPSA